VQLQRVNGGRAARRKENEKGGRLEVWAGVKAGGQMGRGRRLALALNLQHDLSVVVVSRSRGEPVEEKTRGRDREVAVVQ